MDSAQELAQGWVMDSAEYTDQALFSAGARPLEYWERLLFIRGEKLDR